MQTDMLVQNPFIMVVVLTILMVVIMAIYLKLFARVIYEGTTYRHYRKGRLLRESDKGGIILRIPFIDKFEIIPPGEQSIEDIADSLGDNE